MTLGQLFKKLAHTLEHSHELQQEELIMYQYLLSNIDADQFRLMHLGNYHDFYKMVVGTCELVHPKVPHLPFERCVIHLEHSTAPTVNVNHTPVVVIDEVIVVEEVYVDGVQQWHILPILPWPEDQRGALLSRVAVVLVPALNDHGQLHPSQVAIVSTIDGANISQDEEFNNLIMNYAHIVCGLVNVLTCKNITIVEKTHDTKKKPGKKQPRLTYHEIVIRVPGKGYKYKDKTLTEIPFREMEKYESRFQKRGHFKTFTEEAPLFGKHVGTWWWSPIFGQTRNDYVVKIAK